MPLPSQPSRMVTFVRRAEMGPLALYCYTLGQIFIEQIENGIASKHAVNQLFTRFGQRGGYRPPLPGSLRTFFEAMGHLICPYLDPYRHGLWNGVVRFILFTETGISEQDAIETMCALSQRCYSCEDTFSPFPEGAPRDYDSSIFKTDDISSHSVSYV